MADHHSSNVELTGVFSPPVELFAEATGDLDGIEGAIERRLRWEQRRGVNNGARLILWVTLVAHFGITFGDLQAFGGRLSGWEPWSFFTLLGALLVGLGRLRRVLTIGELERWVMVLGLGFQVRVLVLTALCVDGPDLYLGISTILCGFCVTWVDAPGRPSHYTIGAVYLMGIGWAILDPRIAPHLVAYLGVALVFNLGIRRHLRQRAARIRSLTLELGQQAYIDPLTGLHTRRYLDDAGRRQLKRARARHQPLTALYVDLDHFKTINDRFGHEVGDEVLVAAAEAIGDTAIGHLAARHGGEEFVVLARRLSGGDAVALAERIRQAVVHRTEPAVSASVGVAEARPGEALSDVLRRADQALYAAKQGGRDRVVLAPDPGPISPTAPSPRAPTATRAAAP